MGDLQLRYVTHSEIGLVRKNNQDSGYASPHLLVVADGMGGAAAGDLASAVAIDAIRKIDLPPADEHPDTTSGEQMLELLAGALHRANDRIADLIEDDFSLEGMGTTLTGAMFDGTELGLAHIGDSRAYLLRDGQLERLTHDHSWVQSLVDDGRISEAEAAIHPHRSLLLKVLNGQSSSEPDLTRVGLAEGDRLLFCSDGLCGLVDDPVIAEKLAIADPDQALAELVGEAHLAGGIDNITLILADVVAAGGTTEIQVLGAATERDVPPVQVKVPHALREDTIVNEHTLLEASPQSLGPEPAADEARYNPRPPSKRWAHRWILALVVGVLVIGAGVTVGYLWTKSQYYVGASGDQVAIFQGVPDQLPGVSLSTVYEVQALPLSALPEYYQERVRNTIQVASLPEARQTVNELQQIAIRCAPSPTETKSPSVRPSDKPSESAGPSPAPSSSTDPEPSC